MKNTPPGNPLRHLRPSDLRGAVQLATQATQGVTRIAEGVHQSVWSALGVPGGPQAGQTRGLTGMVYKSIQGVTGMVGKGLDAALTRLLPLLEPVGTAPPGSPQREAALAILNGVIGDHLAATGNPLALPMTLRHQGHALQWDEAPHPASLAGASGQVLLLVHGLCMNEQCWHAGKNGQVVDHGETLARALGATPVHLRYNSGLHISQNGHLLAGQLEALVTHWPVPVEALTVLAHSMGGLLIRSAVQSARQQGLTWPDRLKNLVFLATPHHGSPLERAGNWADTVLAGTPFTAPLARLGKLRSAGITDLRYGHVLDADWQGHDRFHRKPDSRQPLPLPEGVACYAVAATLASRRSLLADRLTGDGLVPLHSALGQHDDPARTLRFASGAQWIAFGTGHMELLGRPAVTRQLLHWLAPAASAA